mmetsp:Transcript_22434/g.27626  ORF Transcript_22434/g.27626 Transcript_22434/m.27626 type:complete len:241 (+) Transcript_22434:2709-3431(+)|eukprot:CAMPEP_0170450982 /NCGR_PEP_ID=MMETSP0123-20130129/356_1 /TAXON_ID=182087 /ORGANISM="Favella ehrenbergii, Strain Fehren 1" /LENGTH=240 /DNA_ID=CAMNT_0010712483 /DNA_START=2636 /DNA_END=3358 /DNA_ORIENTATION=-
MAHLFNSDLPMLKLFFYQLDRLVSIFEPDLHTHFKDEMINSSYFASAWFITIFTNSIKNKALKAEGGSDPAQAASVSLEDARVSENLLQLWDYFLVSGWKAILKMGLYVLRDSSSELLQLSFEEILNEITEKPLSILAPNTQIEQVLEESKEQTPAEYGHLYQRLRASFRSTEESSLHGSMLEFHLTRLRAEFEESHSAAKLQPKHNRSSLKAKSQKNPYPQATASKATTATATKSDACK